MPHKFIAPICSLIITPFVALLIHAQDPVLLKTQWDVGKRYVYRDASTFTSEMTLPGMPTPVKQDVVQDQKVSYTVVSGLDNGGRAIRMTFESVKVTMTVVDMSITYDSDDPDASKDDPRARDLVNAYRHLPGFSAMLHVDTKGRLEKIVGLEKAVADIKKKAGPNAKVPAQVFSEQNLSHLYTRLFDLGFPAHAVKPGDAWPHETGVEIGRMKYQLEATCTFNQWTEKNRTRCAELGLEGKVSLDVKADPKFMGMAMSARSGKTGGTIWFDPKQGALVKSEVQTDLNMNLSIPMAGSSEGGGVRMIDRRTIELLDVE